MSFVSLKEIQTINKYLFFISAQGKKKKSSPGLSQGGLLCGHSLPSPPPPPFAASPSCSMGDLVLASFLQVLFQTVFNLLQEEVKLERGLREESRKLISTVSMIEAVLCEAEERQHKERSLRLWLKDLRNFAYDAVDVLDELAYETQRQQRVSFAKARHAISLVNPKRNIFRHNKSKKIQDISKRLEDLKNTAETFGLRVHDGRRQPEEGDELSVSTSLHPPSVHGRERDKHVILEMLLRVDSMSESGVSTIAILGECGIGKTTLAQLIYNHEDVETRFELRSWVDVSHDFNTKRLTKAIIESIDSPAPNHILNMDILQKLLQKKLTGRRFLLVLDNVWNEKPEEWNKFCLPLLRGAEGSKIIVTTRSREVAAIVGSKSPYKLKRLSDDECWSLFCEHAVGRNLYRHSDMADTAKETTGARVCLC